MQQFCAIPRLAFLFFLASACRSAYQPQTIQYSQYKIDTAIAKDLKLHELMKPYADSINKSMNDVIAYSDVKLEKSSPEGTLGNLLADIMMAKATEKFHQHVDVAVVNAGGIRLPSLQPGPITRGKIFEMMPFENQMVLINVDGKLLQLFTNHMAGKRGWPVAGMTYEIQNSKAINIRVGGDDLDQKKVYTVALPDYIASGGDDTEILKTVTQQTRGYLFRDAITEYFSALNSQGKKITSKIENRVKYAEEKIHN